MYEVNGWFKFAEVDDYEHGCDPDTATSWAGDDRFSGQTIDEVLQSLRDFVCVPDDYEVLLDSCEEDGRVDIQVLETEESYPATERQIEAWKKGELKLWHSTYSFEIEEVTRTPVRLTEMQS